MTSQQQSNGHDEIEPGGVVYIEDDRVLVQSPAKPTGVPTDVEYVANSLDHLRHLDLKAIVEQMFGETMPANTAEAMDKIATWALSNKTKVGP